MSLVLQSGQGELIPTSFAVALANAEADLAGERRRPKDEKIQAQNPFCRLAAGNGGLEAHFSGAATPEILDAGSGADGRCSLEYSLATCARKSCRVMISLMGAVSTSPRRNLAKMAEALVNLTVFLMRLTADPGRDCGQADRHGATVLVPATCWI